MLSKQATNQNSTVIASSSGRERGSSVKGKSDRSNNNVKTQEMIDIRNPAMQIREESARSNKKNIVGLVTITRKLKPEERPSVAPVYDIAKNAISVKRLKNNTSSTTNKQINSSFSQESIEERLMRLGTLSEHSLKSSKSNLKHRTF